jgi:hypothetical protein
MTQINLDYRVSDLQRRGVIVTENHETKTVDFSITDETLFKLSKKKLNGVLCEVKKVIPLFVMIGYKVSANGQAVSFAECRLPVYSEQEPGFVNAQVVDVFEHEIHNYLDIDGLKVTPEHLLFVIGRDWTAAGEVKPGDKLVGADGKPKLVKNIQAVHAPGTKVYNLHTNHETHNYFAGGVLVHNAKSNNMWTGGPLNGDGFTVVGDAPGGTWTPYTEVIHNGHVYNAKEARVLRDAGVLDGATYAAGGTSGGGIGGGHQRQPSRGGRSGGGPPGGRRTLPRGGDRVGGTLGSGASVEGNAGATAADVANQVSSETAAVVVSSQQAAQESAQLQTQQQVNAQQQTQQVLAEKLDQVVSVLKKQANKNDMYTLFHSGQQTSI